jgi:hypothetical protein
VQLSILKMADQQECELILKNMQSMEERIIQKIAERMTELSSDESLKKKTDKDLTRKFKR